MSVMPKLTGYYAEEPNPSAGFEDLLKKVHEEIDPLGLKLGSITNLQHGVFDQYHPSHRPSGLLLVSQFPYPGEKVEEGTIVNIVVADIPEACKFYEIRRIPPSSPHHR